MSVSDVGTGECGFGRHGKLAGGARRLLLDTQNCAATARPDVKASVGSSDRKCRRRCQWHAGRGTAWRARTAATRGLRYPGAVEGATGPQRRGAGRPDGWAIKTRGVQTVVGLRQLA